MKHEGSVSVAGFALRDTKLVFERVYAQNRVWRILAYCDAQCASRVPVQSMQDACQCSESMLLRRLCFRHKQCESKGRRHGNQGMMSHPFCAHDTFCVRGEAHDLYISPAGETSFGAMAGDEICCTPRESIRNQISNGMSFRLKIKIK